MFVWGLLPTQSFESLERLLPAASLQLLIHRRRTGFFSSELGGIGARLREGGTGGGGCTGCVRVSPRAGK